MTKLSRNNYSESIGSVFQHEGNNFLCTHIRDTAVAAFLFYNALLTDIKDGKVPYRRSCIGLQENSNHFKDFDEFFFFFKESAQITLPTSSA